MLLSCTDISFESLRCYFVKCSFFLLFWTSFSFGSICYSLWHYFL